MSSAAYITRCPDCDTLQRVDTRCGICGRPITMKDFNRKLFTGEDLEKSEREQQAANTGSTPTLKDEIAFLDQRLEEKVGNENE